MPAQMRRGSQSFGKGAAKRNGGYRTNLKTKNASYVFHLRHGGIDAHGPVQFAKNPGEIKDQQIGS